MRTFYNGGTVSAGRAQAVTICKGTFFKAPQGGMKPVGRKRKLVSMLTVFTLAPMIFGVIYASAASQSEAAWNPPVVIEDEAVPLTWTEESAYLSAIAFETVTVADPELLRGETKVIREGREGMRRVTEQRVYEIDGASRVTSVTSTTITEPLAETVAVGTAEEPSTKSTGSYIWPADGVVSSFYGKRNDVVGSKNHQGIDLAGNRGDSIYAADGGEVISADSKLSGYGLLLQIEHDNGDVTYYAHTNEILVEVGDRVYQGQEVAEMGSSGLSSGVHLHFELRVDGKPVNPTKYLPE